MECEVDSSPAILVSIFASWSGHITSTSSSFIGRHLLANKNLFQHFPTDRLENCSGSLYVQRAEGYLKDMMTGSILRP